MGLLNQSPATINSLKYFYAQFAGPLSPVIGSTSWIAPNNLTLLNVHLSVGTPSTSNIVVNVNRNGVFLGSYTLSANTSLSSKSVLNVALLAGDYITVDIVSAVNGSDLTVFFEYGS